MAVVLFLFYAAADMEKPLGHQRALQSASFIITINHCCQRCLVKIVPSLTKKRSILRPDEQSA